MEAHLRKGLAELGLGDDAAPSLLRFGELLLEKNKVMNLTAITDPEDVASLHFLDSAALLTLKDAAVMDGVLPDQSPVSRQLDVNVLHTLILERLMGIDKENMANQKNLTYTRDMDEAIAGVREGAFQACFVMNPTRVEEIRDVAAAGEKMPQKSTYFYPKLITGLTLNSLDLYESTRSRQIVGFFFS
mgnify:CR=1 FL=1